LTTYSLLSDSIPYGKSDKIDISFSRVKDETDNKGVYNTYNGSGIIHNNAEMFNPTV
jgi:hypothetical protein